MAEMIYTDDQVDFVSAKWGIPYDLMREVVNVPSGIKGASGYTSDQIENIGQYLSQEFQKTGSWFRSVASLFDDEILAGQIVTRAGVVGSEEASAIGQYAAEMGSRGQVPGLRRTVIIGAALVLITLALLQVSK